MITRINEELKQAMRDKNTTKLNVLRALKSAITNASLQKGNVNEELTDNEIIGIIRKETSKRQDSINAFVSAGRDDLILKETNEQEILKEYLPVELSDIELEECVNFSIGLLGATSKRDMGNVIKDVVKRIGGRADNKRISKLVGEKLQ